MIQFNAGRLKAAGFLPLFQMAFRHPSSYFTSFDEKKALYHFLTRSFFSIRLFLPSREFFRDFSFDSRFSFQVFVSATRERHFALVLLEKKKIRRGGKMKRFRFCKDNLKKWNPFEGKTTSGRRKSGLRGFWPKSFVRTFWKSPQWSEKSVYARNGDWVSRIRGELSLPT